MVVGQIGYRGFRIQAPSSRNRKVMFIIDILINAVIVLKERI